MRFIPIQLEEAGFVIQLEEAGFVIQLEDTKPVSSS
jgi:hypothetical protein